MQNIKNLLINGDWDKISESIDNNDDLTGDYKQWIEPGCGSPRLLGKIRAKLEIRMLKMVESKDENRLKERVLDGVDEKANLQGRDEGEEGIHEEDGVEEGKEDCMVKGDGTKDDVTVGNGVNEDGVNEDGVNEDGVNEDGVNKDIVNKDIVNKDGVNKDGVNEDGVNKDIVNKDRVNKDGVNENEAKETNKEDDNEIKDENEKETNEAKVNQDKD